MTQLETRLARAIVELIDEVIALHPKLQAPLEKVRSVVQEVDQ